MKARSWHKTDTQVYQELCDRIEIEFPELHFSERDGFLILSGIYPIADDAGKIFDRYQVEVIIPPDGPTSDIPIVFETGGRIPRDPDRHIENDGRACLFVPEEYWYKHPGGMDLIDFLKGPVKSFFIGQSLSELGKPWPQGERSHGVKGILEFYSEILETDSRIQTHSYLEVLSKDEIKGHWDCPCGSGEKLRKCHIVKVIELKGRIPVSAAKRSLGILIKDITG